MDACSLHSLPDDAFDLVVDKGAHARMRAHTLAHTHTLTPTPTPLSAGLLDAVLCGHDCFSRASSLISGVARVLKPGGALVLVSHGAPSARDSYLRVPDLNWDVTVTRVGSSHRPAARTRALTPACPHARAVQPSRR